MEICLQFSLLINSDAKLSEAIENFGHLLPTVVMLSETVNQRGFVLEFRVHDDIYI